MKLLALSLPYFGKVSTPTDITAINNLSLNAIIHWVITIMLYAIIILSFIFVVIGGLKWMLSQGDKKSLDEARKTITLALGGLILAFLSFFIINIIGYALGVPLLGR